MTRNERLARAGLWIAIIAGVVLALSPIGYRMGWLPLRVSLLWMIPAAVLIGALAVVVSLVAAFLIRRVSGSHGFGVALAGVLLGLVFGGYPASHVIKARRVPPIHDITTDTANPPTFVALAQTRRAAPNGLEYEREKVAELQSQAYPDVKTLHSTLAPTELITRVAKVAEDLGWEVVDSMPEEGRLEATATTRMFGFKDDIVVRVRPGDSGSDLDMRSMSRIGGSDVGTNAARIRGFMEKMRAAGA
jgi:uncharacterized protein (DUF1499 family)